MADTAYFGGNEDSESDTRSNNSDSDEENDDNTSIQSGGVGDSDEEKEENEEEENENEKENNEEEENDEEEEIESENEEFGEDKGEEEEEEEGKKSKKSKKIKQLPLNIEYDDNEDENDNDEPYLKKFDKEINKNYIMEFHPECVLKNYDEIETLTNVIRDKDGIIIDELHRTVPFLTKYEKTRILGQRAKQIDAGATPFVKVPENVIEGYLIAMLELEQKRIPFIIRRPLPNGGSEYWNVKDLENISF
jgi:DNA-directed RNA polymerase subunit K/omega